MAKFDPQDNAHLDFASSMLWKKSFPQMVVNNGDESHGTIRKKSPPKKETQEYGKLSIKDISNRTHWTEP